MKHIRIILCLTLFLTAASAAARVRYTVNDAWRFTKGSPYNAFQPAADDSAWEVVNIPHTWNAEDAADDVPGFYRGPAWYRKRIVLPADAASKTVRSSPRPRPKGWNAGAGHRKRCGGSERQDHPAAALRHEP